MKYSGVLLVVVMLIVGVAYFSVYTVDMREQVVITRLGKVVGERKAEKGIHIKRSFIDFVKRFTKTILVWDG